MGAINPVGGTPIIDAVALATLRQELGASLGRMVGYFSEDGAKLIRQIEEAARTRSAVALVRPAHTLKGDALQFGATMLAEVAERIETAARRAVEDRVYPDEIVSDVVRLRPLFDSATAVLLQETAPVMMVRRGGGFGRKVAPTRL